MSVCVPGGIVIVCLSESAAVRPCQVVADCMVGYVGHVLGQFGGERGQACVPVC